MQRVNEHAHSWPVEVVGTRGYQEWTQFACPHLPPEQGFGTLNGHVSNYNYGCYQKLRHAKD